MNVVSIAGRVAAELGDGWAATGGHWGNHQDAFLVNREVIGRIHVALRDGRLRIGGSLPEGWHEFAPRSWMSDAPEDKNISVAVDKAPGRIAADITRRLLPAWKAYSEYARARKASHDEHEANRDGAAAKLAAMLPGAKVDAKSGDIDLYGVAGVSYGSVQVHADGGVHMRSFSLTPEGATAFFRALGKLSK